MRHIPISVTERSLLYAAETFEQFERLLQFFEKLDDEENFDWWEKLANDVVASDNEDSNSHNDEYNEYYDEFERENDAHKEIVTMEPTTAFSPATDESFEIERDMRASLRQQKGGKVSVQEYVEGIAARYPLLGAAVLEETSRKAVEKTALQAIRILLEHNKVYNWGYLAIFLTMIQYAKGWERAENAGFWAYMAEQFGYKDAADL